MTLWMFLSCNEGVELVPLSCSPESAAGTLGRDIVLFYTLFKCYFILYIILMLVILLHAFYCVLYFAYCLVLTASPQLEAQKLFQTYPEHILH